MARVSRRQKTKRNDALPERRVWRTAVYGRLSNYNAGKETAESLKNQLLYLCAFIEKKDDLTLVDTYLDNGWTGRDFDRPEFRRLIVDVKVGIIDCIVVKDLSRFGRNYLETGDYLENIFPMFGVRFIAINDGYDSIEEFTDSRMSIPIKDMVNELYSRDLGRKVKAAFEIKKERGERISRVPYGYCKDQKEHNRLCLDEWSVPIIRALVEAVMAGERVGQLAKQMTVAGHPRPIQRRMELGLTKKRVVKSSVWCTADVINIVTNPVYTGDMVYDRFIYSGNRYKRVGERPMADWRIVQNTHPAIMSWSEYEQIRNILSKRRRG